MAKKGSAPKAKEGLAPKAKEGYNVKSMDTDQQEDNEEIVAELLYGSCDSCESDDMEYLEERAQFDTKKGQDSKSKKR